MQKRNNYKKGFFGPTIILILVVITAILLYLFGEKIFSKNSAQGAIETCRMSVLAQAKTEIIDTSPLSLNCLRRYIDIHQDHVEFGNNPDKTKAISVYNNGKKIKRYNNLTNDIVNYVVAEEMRICWYQFGEAKVEIFPNDEKLTEIIGTARDNICFICSEIEFINIKNKQFTGLIEYLKNNYPKDKKYTYWEYFNQPSLSEDTLEEFYEKKISVKSDSYITKTDTHRTLLVEVLDYLWDDKIFIFEPDKTYAVIFHKDYDLASKSGYHVIVLPTENIDKICEIQAN